VTIPAELPGISFINISILPNKKDLFERAADPEIQRQQPCSISSLANKPMNMFLLV